MTLGEFQYTDLRFGKLGENGDLEGLTLEERWQIHLARFIFMAFVFLFPLVVLNLLNAVAIGDVQVSSRKVGPLFYSLQSRHVNFFQKRQTVSKDLFTFIFHGKNRKKP